MPTATTRPWPGCDAGRRSRFLRHSCELTLLTRAFDVHDTTCAKFRMPGVAAHVAAQMPAAHALRLSAGFDFHPDPLGARRHRIGHGCIGHDDASLACDEYEPQFVLERRESRGLGFRRVESHFGLERGADLPRRAESLQFAPDISLERD